MKLYVNILLVLVIAIVIVKLMVTPQTLFVEEEITPAFVQQMEDGFKRTYPKAMEVAWGTLEADGQKINWYSYWISGYDQLQFFLDSKLSSETCAKLEKTIQRIQPPYEEDPRVMQYRRKSVNGELWVELESPATYFYFRFSNLDLFDAQAKLAWVFLELSRDGVVDDYSIEKRYL
ncbi:MAG: hypothetical protein Q7K65_00435 [Candidatus Buchananbacteria bacterium]|nr:hypothetical protein [Candidatus Buchananbacteria bacterium]